jgi:XTP/dITP diphosphohydrolase
MILLIATHNPGKLAEYRELLRDLPVELTSLPEQGVQFEPEETGPTFEANATLKAAAFAELSGLPTLADDSGLEIDALGGAPGVHSARYGGTGRGQDAQRIQRVLGQLADVPWPRRTARFRCVVALAAPGRPVQAAHGLVEGIIAREPQGEHGFGYDPIFFLPSYNCTMAQLPTRTKNRISHRAVAIRAALPLIPRLIAER